MKMTGYIRKFGSYTSEQILRMREDLGLQSSPELLERVSAYYQHTKKDPRIEELRLLDRFASTVNAADRNFRIEELYTNDPAAAATYADLMRKRHELSPDARRAPTLPEAASVATAYLHRAGKAVVARDTHLLLGEHFSSGDLCGKVSAVGVENSRFYLQALPRNRMQPAPASEDVLVLLLKEELESYRTHYAKLSRLLMRPEVAGICKQLRTVGEEGLLFETLAISSGLWIDLRRLSLEGVAIDPSMALVGRYVGLRMALVSREDYPSLVSLAEADGIRAAAFATLQPSPVISICEGESRVLTLPTELLRALSSHRPMRAKLPDEVPQGTARIYRRPISEHSCRYLRAPRSCGTLYASEQGMTAAASAQPEAQFLRSALFATLTPVLEVAASGGAYDRQRLSIAIELPLTETREDLCGESVATVLGVYRVQAELGVPAPLLRLQTNPHAAHPTVTVFSTFEGTPIADRCWKEAGARVFLRAIPMTNEGLPDFEDLRHVLKQLEEMHQRGEIRSCAVLQNESLTDALNRMKSDTRTCRVTDPAALAEGALPLAILVESYAAKGWTHVGDVCEEAPSDAAPLEPEEETIPWSGEHARIPSSTLEVLLLSNPQDADAEVLASILNDRGAHVTLCTTADEERDRLARALLGTHLLLLCRDVVLPEDRYVDFALETMQRAGGCVLVLENATPPAHCNLLLLKDGLGERLLDEIASFTAH